MRYQTVAALMFASALTGAGATVGVGLLASRANADRLDPLVLVGQIRELSRLETATVPLTTTVHGERGTGWMRLALGEELVFQGVGEARAGIELGELEPADVWLDAEKVVWVRLPEAKIFGVTLDPDRSQVLAHETGWFAGPSRDFETDARRTALRQLEAQAERIGLREAAAEQAERVVEELLHTLGAAEVRFAAPEPPPSLL